MITLSNSFGPYNYIGENWSCFSFLSLLTLPTAQSMNATSKEMKTDHYVQPADQPMLKVRLIHAASDMLFD